MSESVRPSLLRMMTAAACKVEAAYTSVYAPPSLSTSRNVQSAYMQMEKSVLTCRRPNELPSDLNNEIIVLHMGSRYFRIGLARDALPKLIPNVVAYRQTPSSISTSTSTSSSISTSFSSSSINENGYNDSVVSDAHMTEDELNDRLANRYKTAKKKPPPNIYNSLLTHNTSATPQTIPALNDTFGFEWTKTEGRSVICGKAALRINPDEPYVLRWPWQRGHFNQGQGRSSYDQNINDLKVIWQWALEQELKISKGDFAKYGLVLVVPDDIYGWELRAMMELALNEMRFKAISIMQESISATMGSGVSSALLVDIGAQKTVVACVEDGQLTSGPIRMPYGGDDLTALLHRTLVCHAFPYHECDLRRPLDFELMDELKQRLLTLDEDDLSSQLFEAFVRDPGHSTKVYPFKVFEERWAVANALFEPGVPLLTGPPTADNVTGVCRMRKAEYDANAHYYTSETAEDVTATLPPLQALPIEQVVFAETCKWAGCKAKLTNALECFDHFDQVHTNAANTTECRWNGCKQGRFTDEFHRRCHIGDHLQSMIMQHNTVDTMQVDSINGNTETDPSTPNESLSLEESILRVLEQFGESPEKLKKFLSSVLVVGNGHKIAHFIPHVASLLRTHYPEMEVDFVLGYGSGSKGPTATTKESLTMDAGFVGWKGGAVMARLESTQDAWITPRDWDTCNLRIFRERLTFIPPNQTTSSHP